MNIPLLGLFYLKKETGKSNTPNLTEERIYTYSHYFLYTDTRIPVFSGATANNGIVGYVPDLRMEKQQKKHKVGEILTTEGINYYKNKPEGCITIVADGVYAGYSFYRSLQKYPVFAVNISCLVLYKKPDKKIRETYPNYEGLNLEWFNLKFHNFLLNIVRGEGVKHFTKMVCKNIDNLDIPSLTEQKQELVHLAHLDKIYKKFHQVKRHIELTLSKEVNGFKAVVNNDFLNIFNEPEKGTNALTEEAIYHAMPTKGHEQIPVYGGEKSHIRPRKYIWEKAKNKHYKPVKYFNGECLILSMDGSAGCMTYKPKGEKFTLNHHAACLTIKETYQDKINLKWFKHEYQNTMKEAAISKGSSRTLSKEVLKNIIITTPDITSQEEWVQEIEELERQRELERQQEQEEMENLE